MVNVSVIFRIHVPYDVIAYETEDLAEVSMNDSQLGKVKHHRSSNAVYRREETAVTKLKYVLNALRDS